MKHGAIQTLLCLLTAMFAFSGCMTFPLTEAWRPTVRVVGNSDDLRPAPYTLRVEMEDSTTAGEGAAIKRQLGTILEDMLLRRGFTRVRESAVYAMTFRYRMGTRRFLDWRTEVNNESSTTTTWKAKAAKTQDSTGKKQDSRSKARKSDVDTVIIGKTKSTESSSAVTSSTEQTRYGFVVTLEAANADSATQWQADVVWESESYDVLKQIFIPLKYMVHELPSVPHPTAVERVREDRAAMFYDQFCAGRAFSSPAVPYVITFRKWDTYGDKIRDVYAMQAYVDLLEYADAALPIQENGMEYSELDKVDIRRRLMLGGEYRIGDAAGPVPVFLTLEDNDMGSYEVIEAHVGTPGEYIYFLARLERWQAAERERYEVFE
ncbi:MAG: hypothetical protein WBQ23_09545 [Bacteroidota bacterium]